MKENTRSSAVNTNQVDVVTEENVTYSRGMGIYETDYSTTTDGRRVFTFIDQSVPGKEHRLLQNTIDPLDICFPS